MLNVVSSQPLSVTREQGAPEEKDGEQIDWEASHVKGEGKTEVEINFPSAFQPVKITEEALAVAKSPISPTGSFAPQSTIEEWKITQNTIKEKLEEQIERVKYKTK